MKEGVKLTDAGRTNLRRAQSAVQRMGLLTDDIVTYTQVAAPNEALDQVDLQKLMQQSIKRHQRSIENNNAVVSYTPLPLVQGYRQMLQLLLQHLLGNALKFHQAGSQPQVLVEYTRRLGSDIDHPVDVEPNAYYHCIAVSDSGICLEMAYSEKNLWDVPAALYRRHLQGHRHGTCNMPQSG